MGGGCRPHRAQASPGWTGGWLVSVSLASLAHPGREPGRVSAPAPGTRHRRRAAARSHAWQAVSFAPPKPAQALKTSPTQGREPRHGPRERELHCTTHARREPGRSASSIGESRSARSPNTGSPTAVAPPGASLASLARPRREPGRVSASWPGTRHRRRAAARSHTPQAVSFAPPKQTQALKTSPTQDREPGRSPPARSEPRFARPPTPGTQPRFRTRAGDPAPAAGRSPIPYPQGGLVRAAQTSTGPSSSPTNTGNPSHRPAKRERRFACRQRL
ncbi:hypothetical protein HNR73_000217 [Phytomonospora endophytica]|uniref:Uncharacterized protein n=1 Tax=Phytomonospora endophytica TaxID=714109 RepID=A0A841FAR3_9ACTN|nr:hypothetical protein [Phytomonospora endophytica]